MQTLGSEALLNAGFLFFILLILSTLILGRFFCGWACHVVALQDLCTWILRKLGLRPKPFRSRLLMFVPLLAAFYLFVMPTLVRLYLGDTRIAPQDSECSICTAPPGATRMPGAWKRNCKRVLNPRRSLAVRWDLRVRWTAMEREHS